jgi:hypothetical protein
MWTFFVFLRPRRNKNDFFVFFVFFFWSATTGVNGEDDDDDDAAVVEVVVVVVVVVEDMGVVGADSGTSMVVGTSSGTNFARLEYTFQQNTMLGGLLSVPCFSEVCRPRLGSGAL